MIERYSRKEITGIWEEKNKYQIWLNIEIIHTRFKTIAINVSTIIMFLIVKICI